jgi:hypothetical protein
METGTLIAGRTASENFQFTLADHPCIVGRAHESALARLLNCANARPSLKRRPAV